MRAKTSIWFECKVAYEKTMEDGLQKKVKELYCVEAQDFAKEQQMVTEEMSAYINGEFDVVSESIAPYKEVFIADYTTFDKWYKSKVQLITLDERTDKEKKTNVYYLTNADTLEQARKNIVDVMGKSMQDYAFVAVQETAIVDLFEKQP